MGCSSSSAPPDGGAAPDGGSGGRDAMAVDSGQGRSDAAADGSRGEPEALAEGGGRGDAGSCVLPGCLANLATGCMPSGTCTQNTDPTTGDISSCYSNGITRGDLMDVSSGNQILAAKNATSTCYAIDYSGNDVYSDNPTTATVTSGADAGVATMQLNVANDGGISWSVTCTGGTAVTLDPSCQMAWPLAWMMGFGGPQGCTSSATCSF